LIEVIGFFGAMFRARGRDETILWTDETIFDFDAELRKRQSVTTPRAQGWASLDKPPETVKMRILSFLLAFALVLAGATLAGSPDGSLPGIGTFASPSIVVAAR
jgi:hypothetical protein